MADQPVTKEKLINADIDVENLGKAVNEKGVVNPRYGDSYLTLPSAIQKVIETGGFEPFMTEVALLASVPALPKKAAKALDTKKVWLWDGTKWNDTGLSEYDQARDDTINVSKKFIETDADLSEPNNKNDLEIKNGENIRSLAKVKNCLY